jgi:hypothetical protein
MSSTAVVALEGAPTMSADPPEYRILPGRYMTDEPLTTPLAPPTGVHVLLVTSRA